MSFEQVWTTAMRVVFSSTPVGLSELEAYAADPLGVDDVHRMVQAGTTAEELDLPTTVSAHYADGSRPRPQGQLARRHRRPARRRRG